MPINSDSERTLGDVIDTMTDEQKKVTFALMKSAARNGKEIPKELEDRQAVKRIIDGMTDEQRIAMYAMVGINCPPTNETSSDTN